MRYVLDTNVFIASLINEPERGDVATELMNLDAEFFASRLSLMELRTVLCKKHHVEQAEVEGIIEDIEERVKVIEDVEMGTADELQAETLLYPMDACIYAAAYEELMPGSGIPHPTGFLVTFDAELLGQVQVITPERAISLAEMEERRRQQQDEDQSGS